MGVRPGRRAAAKNDVKACLGKPSAKVVFLARWDLPHTRSHYDPASPILSSSSSSSSAMLASQKSADQGSEAELKFWCEASTQRLRVVSEERPAAPNKWRQSTSARASVRFIAASTLSSWG